jgi:hypothetical protein
MRNIVLSVLVCALTAVAAPAQIIVAGGGIPIGIPTGASIWYGTSAPLNTVGANGDYYLNTSSYCLYGPKSAGVWSSACVSSVRQLGYIAENVANRGAGGGYAPLDTNALVPAANLPALTAINGTSIPSNNAPDQTVVTTAPTVGAWTTLPACPDTGGNHLNYSLVTHGFLCGSTGGTAGSVGFGGVGGGTNANGLLVSGTLGYTGGGQINANQLGGVTLSTLPSGLLKIIGGTGTPSIAIASDVTSTLGFNPENTTNKNAANGYAPLDANALVPTANLPTIANINGTSIPINSAPDQTVVTMAPSVAAWAALPSCPDAGGYHLNYSTVTHGFVCGNTGGTAGSVSFGGVGPGMNANSLLVGGTLSYAGAGQINANQLSGVSLAGLSTGILKITSGSGVPSVAASSDVKGALGFTPENAANRNAANGYAPLDANGLLPAANLPAIAAVNGTSVPSNNASDQTVVTTAPSVAAWAALPACPDTTGNHLNYSSITHSFLCGNTGGAVGSVQFNSVQGGTNSDALLVAGSLDYTGGGQINANQLSGVYLPSLPTGLLKITTGTGAPSAATSSDVTNTLGFNPENSGNKGAPGGYAPLDGSGLLPAANLPAGTVTATNLNNATLPVNVTSLATTSDITSGGALTAMGNIYANSGSNAAGCLHLSDANGLHDMGICAPFFGYNGLFTLPPTAGAAGQAYTSDGAGGSVWSTLANTVFGRSGTIASQTGDYSFPQIAGMAASSQLPLSNMGAVTGGTWSAKLLNASMGTGASSLSRTVTAGAGGVTANLLAAKDISASTLYTLPSSGSCGAGIAASSASSGAQFELYSVPGTAMLGVADNAITAGHILIGGTSTYGAVADSGYSSRSSIPNTTCTVGVALTSAPAGGTVLLSYDGTGVYGTQANYIAPYTGALTRTVQAELSDTIKDIQFTSFSAACTAAANAGKILAVLGSWPSLSTQSCNANLQFYVGSGVLLQVASGQTLSLNGQVFAGRWQVFAGAGTVSFSSNHQMSEVYPEWWGADPTGVVESSAAWQSAVTAAHNLGGTGGTVSCPNATYNLANTITSFVPGTGAISLRGPDNMIDGTGAGCTLQWNGVSGGTIFHYIGGHNGIIKGINFDANGIASRGLWMDSSNGATSVSYSISSISRSGNVVTVQTSAAHSLLPGLNVTISGVADTSYNGTFPLWYAADSTHFSYSQSGATSSSNGGSAAVALSTDTESTRIEHNVFNVPASTTASVSSCSITSNVLSCTLASPVILYPNQWIWITGSSDPVYNAYWQILQPTSPTTFTAAAAEVASEASTATGTLYGPSEGVSFGSNNLALVNNSVCCMTLTDNHMLGTGGGPPFPLFAFAFDGTGNTKNFWFHNNRVTSWRIGWMNWTVGAFESDGDNGANIIDAIYASPIHTTSSIHGGEWESGGYDNAYFVASMVSGSFMANTLGVAGQFELPLWGAAGTPGNLILSGNSVEMFQYAPDAVAVSTSANLVMTGNVFYELNSTSAIPVINASSYFATLAQPGYNTRQSVYSVGNTFANVPPGGWIPIVNKFQGNYTAYGSGGRLGGIPVTTIGDKGVSAANNQTYPLSQGETLSVLKYLAPPVTGVSAYSTTPTSGGAGFASGDVGKVFTVACGANGTITTVSGGAVTAIGGAVGASAGTGCTTGAGQAATCSACAGSGLTVNITAITGAPPDDAASGFIQLPNNVIGMAWRNGADSGDDTLSVSPSDTLLYNGSPLSPTRRAPYWLQYLGNGSDGSLNCTSGTCAYNGEYWLSSFNVSAGATVSVPAAYQPLIIHATGTCTIAGAVGNGPNSTAGTGTTGQGDFGSPGGGGGGGTLAGVVGSGIGFNNITYLNGGAGGAASGGAGTNGPANSKRYYEHFLSSGSAWPVGGGRGGAGGSSGPVGGNGGGNVVFACGTINFTGTIDVSGGNGAASTANNMGASGGGGGGDVILASLNLTNAGTINVSGGAGGGCGSYTGCGTGGHGGAGWSYAFVIQ